VLSPSSHITGVRCGKLKVTVRGAGFHDDSVVEIMENYQRPYQPPGVLPELVMIGKTTVRNEEFVFDHSFDLGFPEEVVFERTQRFELLVRGQQSDVTIHKEVYVYYRQPQRKYRLNQPRPAPDTSCGRPIPPVTVVVPSGGPEQMTTTT